MKSGMGMTGMCLQSDRNGSCGFAALPLLHLVLVGQIDSNCVASQRNAMPTS